MTAPLPLLVAVVVAVLLLRSLYVDRVSIRTGELVVLILGLLCCTRSSSDRLRMNGAPAMCGFEMQEAEGKGDHGAEVERAREMVPASADADLSAPVVSKDRTRASLRR